MKLINKLTLLVLLSSLMVACGKKETIKPDAPNNDEPDVIEQTINNEGSSETFGYLGRQFSGDCCNPDHLSDPNNLLSQRVIFFAYDQATVESDYRELIALHARYLSENPSAKMVLEGHADERGTPEYNLALGEKRAKSVSNLMNNLGASAGQISEVSFGEEKPVALCNDESCWSQNRRVRIVYTSK